VHIVCLIGDIGKRATTVNHGVVGVPGEEERVPVLRQDGVFMETGTTSSRSAPSEQALLSTALGMVVGKKT
jgi:hypothetical protein